MSLFDRPVYCDECGAQFVVDDSRIGSIKKDDLEAQHLSWKAIQTKIKAAHAKRFKERTFKKYMREYNQIKKEQEDMMPALRATGEELLHGGEPSV